MRPGLQGDPPGRDLPELLFQPRLRARHPSPFDDLSRGVQDAEMAVLISHVDSDGDLWLSLAGAPAPRFVGFLAMLFHGRFLSALRVRSLGSLTASRMEPAFSFHLRVSAVRGLLRCNRPSSTAEIPCRFPGFL